MIELFEYILIALACPLVLPMIEPQESEEKICKNCINAKECVMYEPNMKRCKDYKTESEEKKHEI